MKCLDLPLPQMLSRHVCLCCGATWSTTCCIVLPPTPRTPWCLEPVCIDLASQTVRYVHLKQTWHNLQIHNVVSKTPLSGFSLIVIISFKYSCSSDSFGGLQASGGRCLGLSRVSQQDLDLVRNGTRGHERNVSYTLNAALTNLNLVRLFTLLPTLVLIPSVCVTAAEEWHGCRFRRGSAEEAAGGGGFVQPGPLPLHLHPGPGSQDPWPAPTAQKLRHTHKYKDCPRPKISVWYWLKPSAKRQ